MNIFFPPARERRRFVFRPAGLSAHRAAICLLAGAGIFNLVPLSASGADSDLVVSVYSSVSPDYTRTPLPDGGFKSETYSFGEGGDLGGVQKDLTFEQLKFTDIIRRIAPSLKAQSYISGNTADPSQTQLLIMVYWGTTTGTDGSLYSSRYVNASALASQPPVPPPPPPPTGMQGGQEMVSDPTVSGAAAMHAQISVLQAAADAVQQQYVMMTGLANRQRDQQAMANAAILGYLPEMKRVVAYDRSALDQRRQDVVEEVEEGRYYVVLLAYDFQILLHNKQRKLLWETRFSIRERRNDFGEQLEAMAESAARYFGRDSGGLLRKPMPATSVHLGELKILGVAPDEKK